MPNPNYQRALNRSDLSQWVVHFVRSITEIYLGRIGNAAEILNSIFAECYIRPSCQEYITRYCSEGAACFYDAPPAVWSEIACTNPSVRQPLGIICHKHPLWLLGGRPVIYTELSDPSIWPESQRFRIVRTDLLRDPQPIDWMHEREWRIRGGLSLRQPQFMYRWWWPIVPNDDWVRYLWQTYAEIDQVYVIGRNQLVSRGMRIL
jgi:hypothetical protein